MTTQTIDQNLNIETLQTTAVFDENGFLHATRPLPGRSGETVQIIVIRVQGEKPEAEIEYEMSDPSPQEWNRMLMQSSAFKEWADPAEDIYTLEDGEPIAWDKP